MTVYRDYENQQYTAAPYVRGNVIAKPEYLPREPKRRRQVDPQVRKNRAREAAMTAKTMVFLAVATVAMVAICVFYLNNQSTIQVQSQQISALETQVAEQKADNDARYNQINDSINLDEVRNRAVNELGMSYVTDSQIILYSEPQEDFVDQKAAIPKDVVE